MSVKVLDTRRGHVENCWEQPTPWASLSGRLGWPTRSQGSAQQCTKELLQQQQAGETWASSGTGGVGVGDRTLGKQVVLRIPASPQGREFLDFAHSSARSGPCLVPDLSFHSLPAGTPIHCYPVSVATWCSLPVDILFYNLSAKLRPDLS